MKPASLAYLICDLSVSELAILSSPISVQERWWMGLLVAGDSGLQVLRRDQNHSLR
jgi:hypothetical protein